MYAPTIRIGDHDVREKVQFCIGFRWKLEIGAFRRAMVECMAGKNIRGPVSFRYRTERTHSQFIVECTKQEDAEKIRDAATELEKLIENAIFASGLVEMIEKA